ncbi:uncharacterized protein LOC103516116 [Diaphorina citri]|uniref:Uncharacterized protein LOC103516116 n=1 Tax=Diaphorina citri TaxID=121845 RepID=A0A3Q0J7F8_DIACI|nr:uncharacterized protein LOC103516116 [Diaphorina citri]
MDCEPEGSDAANGTSFDHMYCTPKTGSIVKLHAVFAKFKDDIALFRKGEMACQNGDVQDASYDPKLKILQGLVFSPMKTKVFSVEVTLVKDKIGQCFCSCPRDKPLCHHIAALLIHCYEKMTKADTIFQPRKDYEPCRSPTEEDMRFFLEELRKLNGPMTGMQWLLECHFEDDRPKQKVPSKKKTTTAGSNKVKRSRKRLKSDTEDSDPEESNMIDLRP